MKHFNFLNVQSTRLLPTDRSVAPHTIGETPLDLIHDARIAF